MNIHQFQRPWHVDRHAAVIGAVLAAQLLCLASGCSAAEPTTDNTGTSPAARIPVAKQSAAQKLSAENPLNAKRAMSYLTQLCKLGPRPTGSDAMVRQQTMLTAYFEKLGGQVSRQEFFMLHPITRKRIRVANLLIEWHPEAKDRVLLCAHYDTRPLPDQDPNPTRRRDGVFVGANDGASGVAVLMELAHHLPETDLQVGVDMVLFDAEELVYGASQRTQRGEYFVGSTHFAQQYRKQPPAHRYRWGVLLDMVGDAELELLQERYSMSWPETRPLVMQLWRTAARLGVKEFVPRTRHNVIRDDHIPLRNIARIPTCDIIDADYPDAPFGAPGSYWHTEQDTPDKCSGESLAKVGWVVLEWLKTAGSQP